MGRSAGDRRWPVGEDRSLGAVGGPVGWGPVVWAGRWAGRLGAGRWGPVGGPVGWGPVGCRGPSCRPVSARRSALAGHTLMHPSFARPLVKPRDAFHSDISSVEHRPGFGAVRHRLLASSSGSQVLRYRRLDQRRLNVTVSYTLPHPASADSTSP